MSQANDDWSVDPRDYESRSEAARRSLDEITSGRRRPDRKIGKGKRADAAPGDMHRETAAKLFGVPADEVTPEQRRAGKAANFFAAYTPDLGGMPGDAVQDPPEVDSPTVTGFYRSIPAAGSRPSLFYLDFERAECAVIGAAGARLEKGFEAIKSVRLQGPLHNIHKDHEETERRADQAGHADTEGR